MMLLARPWCSFARLVSCVVLPQSTLKHMNLICDIQVSYMSHSYAYMHSVCILYVQKKTLFLHTCNIHIYISLATYKFSLIYVTCMQINVRQKKTKLVAPLMFMMLINIYKYVQQLDIFQIQWQYTSIHHIAANIILF